MVETLPLLGVCNLCLTEGAVKSMLIPQKHEGIQELYSDMLLKCFSIDVSRLFLHIHTRISIECSITDGLFTSLILYNLDPVLVTKRFKFRYCSKFKERFLFDSRCRLFLRYSRRLKWFCCGL